MTLGEVEAALAPTGLVFRGAFHPRAEDGVPALATGAAPGTLALVGNVGPAMWRSFTREPRDPAAPHALDEWSRRVVSALAARLGAEAIFPFGGPPWLPFQRWAQRAEPVYPSPIGPLIHPDYGLWHAYRGALAFAARLELPPRDRRPSPCETCRERPCLDTCPVAAFTPQGYDVPRCIDHVVSPAGDDCAGLGCRARRACPVGQSYHYQPAQARFHMTAFVRANRAAHRNNVSTPE